VKVMVVSSFKCCSVSLTDKTMIPHGEAFVKHLFHIFTNLFFSVGCGVLCNLHKQKVSTLPCVSFWVFCTKNKICAICLLTLVAGCAIIFRAHGAAGDNNECANGGQISDNCPVRIMKRRCL
jgi:hypothetical protein